MSDSGGGFKGIGSVSSSDVCEDLLSVAEGGLPKLIYHDDLDGICSAAIWLATHPQVEYICICASYDSPPVLLDGDTVVMLDFSVSEIPMTVNLVWIDHHKTVKDRMLAMRKMNSEVVFASAGEAACVATWKYCYPSQPVPTAVQLLSDYDVWNLGDRVVPFQYGMKDVGLHDPIWERLFGEFAGDTIEGICSIGTTRLRWNDVLIARFIVNGAYHARWCGLECGFLNTPMTGSRSLESYYSDHGLELMVIYYWAKDRWSVHLYSTFDLVDCASIAISYGGGGHKRAAGFQCSHLPWVL